MIKKVNNIRSLEKFTFDIGSRSQHFVQDFQGLLYHYTDLNALISILSNHDLWLTNSRFSNDEHEITHGYNVAFSVIKEKREQSLDQQHHIVNKLETGCVVGTLKKLLCIFL